jgi:preprotein translocase subunit SecF
VLLDDSAEEISVEYSRRSRTLEVQLEQRGTSSDDNSWYYYEFKFSQDELAQWIVETVGGTLSKEQRRNMILALLSD